jgi:hypothetical protein
MPNSRRLMDERFQEILLHYKNTRLSKADVAIKLLLTYNIEAIDTYFSQEYLREIAGI